MIRLLCAVLLLTGCATKQKIQSAYDAGVIRGQDIVKERVTADYISIGQEVEKMRDDFSSRLAATQKRLEECLEADARGK